MKKMKTYIFVLMLLSIALIAVPASAATTYTCVGNVTNLNVYSASIVTLSVPGQSPQIYLCSLNSNFGNGWTADSCKAAYAILLSAKLSGLQVLMEFNDNFTCANPEVGAQGTGAYAVTILP
jgi:hypothetical protein